MCGSPACLWRPTTLLVLLAWCASAGAQEGLSTGAPASFKVSGLPFELALQNVAESIRVLDGGVLRLAAKGGTNLFNSPGGNYYRQDAPMALFRPDDSFLLTAKVSAELKSVYDVAALVVYQDDDWWAKLCFENSIKQEATIVSVITKQYSDDCNSVRTANPYAFLAVAKRGAEFSFHYSREGRQWELIRHFRMDFKEGFKVGFAVHGSRGAGFAASFSDVTYSSTPPKDMRQLD